MNVLTIDWNRLIPLLLPPALRKPRLSAFLRSLIVPVMVLYNDFHSFRQVQLYKLSHNGQVCYLKAALNDRFDNELRRITIGNLPYQEPVWLSDPEENEEVWVDDEEPIFLSSTDEFINNVDFVVIVPLELQPPTPEGLLAFETEMNGLIAYYKLYSKNHRIQWENI